MAKAKDLTGKKFGALEVLRLSDKPRIWVCLCNVCGKEKLYRSSSLVPSHKYKSCGCVRGYEETPRERNIKTKPAQDLTGLSFGALKVIKEGALPCSWLCECGVCGKEKLYRSSSLVPSHKYKSCGCVKGENSGKPIKNDLAGQKQGKLTILHLAGGNINGSAVWACKCDCGKTVNLSRNALVCWKQKSCGCLKAAK